MVRLLGEFKPVRDGGANQINLQGATWPQPWGTFRVTTALRVQPDFPYIKK